MHWPPPNARRRMAVSGTMRGFWASKTSRFSVLLKRPLLLCFDIPRGFGDDGERYTSSGSLSTARGAASGSAASVAVALRASTRDGSIGMCRAYLAALLPRALIYSICGIGRYHSKSSFLIDCAKEERKKMDRPERETERPTPRGPTDGERDFKQSLWPK